jgi:cell fate (sporulation/competence/biofilm development) regulator YmcA (YheA/YmcA/DUF963 family)
MNTTKSVYNKLFKEEATELASHEVALSTIKILEDDNVRMKKGLERLKALRQEMKKVYLDSIDGANTNWGNFKQKAKELGLNPDDFPLVKNFTDRQRDLDDAYYAPNKL